MKIDNVTSIALAAIQAAGVKITSHRQRMAIAQAAAIAAEKIADRASGMPARERAGRPVVVA